MVAMFVAQLLSACTSSHQPQGAASAPGQVRVAPNGVIGNTLCLNATSANQRNTYPHIESVFGKGAVESPSDSVYSPDMPHVVGVPDDPLVGPHFAIISIEPSDVNQDLIAIDNGGDRSRSEIKIAPSKVGVHTAFQARQGDTYVYAWRFRIESGMKFSPAFTHIHQIKAYGGAFSDPPLITFTPLANGQMEVRHVGNGQKNSSASTVLGSMALRGVADQWMDVREEITYANSDGRYRLSIVDESGASRLDILKENLQMWRSGAEHMRPKWGIYRKHHEALNQHRADHVYFANFAITRGSVPASNCR